jgi:hypothetical protein
MLLQATYFSTINPQFVGLPTHILRYLPPHNLPHPTHNPQVKTLGSAHVCSWAAKAVLITMIRRHVRVGKCGPHHITRVVWLMYCGVVWYHPTLVYSKQSWELPHRVVGCV